MEDKDRNTAKRPKQYIIIAAVCMCVAGFVLYLVQLEVSSSPLEFRRLLTQKPGGPMMLAGLLLVVVGAITLAFRSQMGSWFARLVRWLGGFFLGNTQHSGATLPDEGVERNLAPKFNDKMVVVMAAMDLCVGLCLIGAGCVLNMAP